MWGPEFADGVLWWRIYDIISLRIWMTALHRWCGVFKYILTQTKTQYGTVFVPSKIEYEHIGVLSLCRGWRAPGRISSLGRGCNELCSRWLVYGTHGCVLSIEQVFVLLYGGTRRFSRATLKLTFLWIVRSDARESYEHNAYSSSTLIPHV